MKKILKYTFAALLGVMALASCTNEYEYDPAPANEQGGNGFINAAETIFMFTPSDEQTFTFTVGRVDAKSAGSIKLTSDNPNVTVPATVEFAAEEATKTVSATCNVAVGATETVTISVADDDAFIYQQNAATFTIQVFPEHKVTYIYGLTINDYPDGFDLSVYELGNGKYRLPAYVYDYDIDFTIDAKNNVYVAPQPAWINSQYGDVYIMGNLNGDATPNGKGSGLAGKYDPETGLIEFTLLHYVPGLGSFTAYSKRHDYLIFTGK